MEGGSRLAPVARRWLRPSPWRVAAAVLTLYTLGVAVYLGLGHDPRSFVRIGSKFITRSHASAVITSVYDPRYVYPADTAGNDGQWSYYLALDPANARYYMDFPAYRYTRIIYPMTARLLALGQPGAIPYTLILVNVLALAGGTWAIAAWLARKGYSAWLALLYGFYPGLFVVLQRDLTEALAYGLVATAIYLYDYGGSSVGRRMLWAGCLFALAGLTREVTMVFPALYGLAALLQDAGPLWARVRASWRQAAMLLGVAFTPFVLYKLFLLAWLGQTGARADLVPSLVPLGGLFALWPWNTQQVVVIPASVLPALICLAAALWALWRRQWGAEVWALLVNVVLFVLYLAPTSLYLYTGTGRITTGVVLAALLCLPALDRATGGRRAWLAASTALWFLGVPLGLAIASLLRLPRG
jgi:hypothetical protein